MVVGCYGISNAQRKGYIYIKAAAYLYIKTALLQINHPSKHIIIKGKICFAHLHKKKGGGGGQVGGEVGLEGSYFSYPTRNYKT